MWFDARAKLAEIESRQAATSATTATQAPAAPPNVAVVAEVATPQRQKLQPATKVQEAEAKPARAQSKPLPAKPTRMLFCGICRAWETPEVRCQHITEILEAMPWTVEFHTVG
jgi:hypothetical protein